MAEENEASNLTGARPDVEIKSTIAAFTSLIQVFELPDHAELNALLTAEIANWRADAESMKSSNKLGWHSPRELFEREEPGFRELCRRIIAVFQRCVQRHAPEFRIRDSKSALEGWINVNERGAFNAPHGHATHHFSGVYYVSAPESAEDWSGLIEFFNPIGAVTPQEKLGKMMLPEKWRIKPVPGQMVIFPSYMKHWVYPNQEDEDRISIAFNISVLDLGVEIPEQEGLPN